LKYNGIINLFYLQPGSGSLGLQGLRLAAAQQIVSCNI